MRARETTTRSMRARETTTRSMRAPETTTRSMHYERAALLSGVYRGDVGQESEEKIGKPAEE
jgi:hypothetical protein